MDLNLKMESEQKNFRIVRILKNCKNCKNFSLIVLNCLGADLSVVTFRGLWSFSSFDGFM